VGCAKAQGVLTPPASRRGEPYKKPSKQALTFSQKLYNQILNFLRVVIEHAHSGNAEFNVNSEQKIVPFFLSGRCRAQLL
jgi:hypothetical protein